MVAHTSASCLPYHSHSDLAESSVIMHRFCDNTIYTPPLSQYFPNVSLNLVTLIISYAITLIGYNKHISGGYF